jgi:titin
MIPSTPRITNTDYGDEEIYLTVSVADDGGSTISSYTATCTDGTTQYTGTSTISRITVSGLTNGVGYSCFVTATNAAGTSTQSASSPLIVPEEFIATGLPMFLLYEAMKSASP